MSIDFIEAVKSFFIVSGTSYYIVLNSLYGNLQFVSSHDNHY